MLYFGGCREDPISLWGPWPSIWMAAAEIWATVWSPRVSAEVDIQTTVAWKSNTSQAPAQRRFSSVQSLSRVRLFATPWIAACQASLSITNSWSSLKLTSIESVMPSSHLILRCPLLLLPQSLPASESFPVSQLLAWGGQSTGVSALASFLPKNTQDWSPLEWTVWISL